jgi:molybdenum cofactor cytidylyltransferase
MAQQTKIAAIVLAAGASHRFGAADKLQAHLDNETVLGRSLAAYANAPLARKIAVTRPDKNLAAICAAAGFEVIINRRADDGMGTSIATAIAALQGETHALIGLGDMPRLQPQTVALLCQSAENSGRSNSIIMPTHANKLGHPRLFAAAHFNALAALTGDMGGRLIIEGYDNVMEMPVNDDGVILDIDTQDHLSAAQS